MHSQVSLAKRMRELSAKAQRVQQAIDDVKASKAASRALCDRCEGALLLLRQLQTLGGGRWMGASQPDEFMDGGMAMTKLDIRLRRMEQSGALLELMLAISNPGRIVKERIEHLRRVLEIAKHEKHEKHETHEKIEDDKCNLAEGRRAQPSWGSIRSSSICKRKSCRSRSRISSSSNPHSRR